MGNILAAEAYSYIINGGVLKSYRTDDVVIGKLSDKEYLSLALEKKLKGSYSTKYKNMLRVIYNAITIIMNGDSLSSNHIHEYLDRYTSNTSFNTIRRHLNVLVNEAVISGMIHNPMDGLKIPAQLEESVKFENRSYFSTVLGLAFRKLDVFGYYKFVTAVKNINLLPNRDSMIAQKKAKAFSNFAFKGIIGIVSIIYIMLFGLSFWQITSLNSKVSNYDQIVQNHQLKEAEVNKFSKQLGKLNKSLELSSSIKSNKKINFRVLAQIASAVPKRVRFLKIDYNGSDQIIIEGLAASDQDILKLISNLNNKQLISQASLASMMLPTSSGNNTRNMKGFIIACIIGAA